MLLEIIIFTLPFIIPYTIIGYEVGNILLTFIALIYTVFCIKKVKVDKNSIIALIVMLFFSVISLITKFTIQSLGGISLYITPILYYIIFSHMLGQGRKNDVMKYSVYIIAVISAISVIYEGMFLKLRVFGLFGYANTFALSLLIAIHINSLQKETTEKTVIDVILITSIFFTGSRNTLFYLLVYAIIVYIKRKKLMFIASILVSVVIYVLIAYVSLVGVLFSPVLIYIYILLMKRFSINISKTKRITGLIVFLVLIALTIGMSGNNTAERIKNISITNGSMQERIIIFEDTLKAVAKNPLGYGIDSFSEYRSYIQTAYYNAKYVHNSVLQIAFDTGIVSIIPFLFLFIYVITQNLKKIFRKEPVQILDLSMFIIIFLHGLLDFDFSFASIYVLWILLIALNLEGKKELDLSRIASVIPIYVVAVFQLVMLYNEGIIKLSDYMLKTDNYVSARNVVSKVLFKDSRYYNAISDAYKWEYNKVSNPKLLEEMEKNLDKAISLDNQDLSLKRDMAYVKEKSGRYEEAINIWKDVISEEKYNPEVYKSYYIFLSNLYKKDDLSLNKQIKWLEEKHDEAYNSLNPKNKYIKNQLKHTLKETLEMDINE